MVRKGKVFFTYSESGLNVYEIMLGCYIPVFNM